MHRLTSYRQFVAHFLLVWMCGIIISGVVFMHKEVTSTGEIVTHIHPYNLGEKNHHHHHSDAEIRFLDIVYQGSYLHWSPFVFEVPILPEFNVYEFGFKTFNIIFQIHDIRAGRGPPSFLA
ncbi:Uncharacterised protein [Sphingobacterium mizutaii]|uniref:Uncharacterized protein n=2 Tax=Sphingobacterium mizutaii TaxID=1010 RepID=A0AAJ4X9M2_9SPHI|nr:hypothetical protein [Sphingobacterium mizutaii]SDL37276.1 hypothetical protein SAMN05192578_10362 [Sphingobacterium mizutaii]SNV43279.1 Uncharacterised protein [Sphingobacterium mizutaii]